MGCGMLEPMPLSPEDAIRRLLESQIAAWNAGDADGWCRDFTVDSGFVNIIGARFEGRDANVRRHARLFATLFKGSRLAIRDLTILLLDDATAIAHLVLDLTGFSELPPGIRPTVGDHLLRTRMHYVLVRAPASWSIVYSQNTAVLPSP